MHKDVCHKWCKWSFVINVSIAGALNNMSPKQFFSIDLANSDYFLAAIMWAYFESRSDFQHSEVYKSSVWLTWMWRLSLSIWSRYWGRAWTNFCISLVDSSCPSLFQKQPLWNKCCFTSHQWILLVIWRILKNITQEYLNYYKQEVLELHIKAHWKIQLSRVFPTTEQKTYSRKSPSTYLVPNLIWAALFLFVKADILSVMRINACSNICPEVNFWNNRFLT